MYTYWTTAEREGPKTDLGKRGRGQRILSPESLEARKKGEVPTRQAVRGPTVTQSSGSPSSGSLEVGMKAG
jgi:hypothetical protein